ncbi:MAG: NAD(P)-dependent alcohol dehydrogenase [Deltaproteobacteria bacterium]|nr:NAD(P)-dependent alcohol dehydrogenase [Deltaproteobacteria bacterium]
MKRPTHIHGWGTSHKGAPLERMEKEIPALAGHEVLLKVMACGICHSDVHLIDDDWNFTPYPLIPGHEIVGHVIEKGAEVKHLSCGTIVGVGWQRGACLQCDDCVSGRENMCDGRTATCVEHWGGFADYHVTDSRFCFPIPKELKPEEAAPLMCGGATVFSPLCEFLPLKMHRTARVGVIALGGLGHLAVKMAAHMGYDVTLFSSSEKKQQAAESMGARHFVPSNKASEIRKLGRNLDLILVTANADLPWNTYLETLRSDGTLCFVGVPPSSLSVQVFELLGKRLRVVASPIGSRHDISRMLEFCARHKITAATELFPLEKVNEGLKRVREGSVRFRAVLIP